MNNNYNIEPTIIPISGNLALYSKRSDLVIALPTFLRIKMEYAFNADFSNVKIYLNQRPHEFNAIAFASAESICILPEHYHPETFTGQVLIGHELTHIVQQRRQQVNHESNFAYPKVVEDSHLEQEADWCGFLAALGLETPLAKPFLLSPLSKKQAFSPIIQCVKREYPYQDNQGKTHFIKTYEIVKVLDKVVEELLKQNIINKKPDKKLANDYHIHRDKKNKTIEPTVPLYQMNSFQDWLASHKHLTAVKSGGKDIWYPCHLEVSATKRQVVIDTGQHPLYDAYLLDSITLKTGQIQPVGGNHSYNMVAKEGGRLVQQFKIEDAALAQAIIDVATGKPSALCDKHAEISAFVTDLTALMFGIEASRDRLFFGTNFMMMDLIAKKATFGKNGKPFLFQNVFDAVYLDTTTSTWRYKPFPEGNEKSRKTEGSKEWVDSKTSYMPTAALVDVKPIKKSTKDEKFDPLKKDGGLKNKKRNPLGGKNPGTGLKSGSKNYSEMGTLLAREGKNNKSLKATMSEEFDKNELRVRHAVLLKSASASVHWLIADDKTNPFKNKTYQDERALLSEIEKIFKQHIFEERLLNKQAVVHPGVSASSSSSTSSTDASNVSPLTSLSKITLKDTGNKYMLNDEQLIELTADKAHELLRISEESFFEVLKDANKHQLMSEIFYQDIQPSLIEDDKGKADSFSHILALMDKRLDEVKNLRGILNNVKDDLDLDDEINEAHEILDYLSDLTTDVSQSYYKLIDNQQKKIYKLDQQINKYFAENFINEYAALYKAGKLPLNHQLVALWAKQESVNLKISQDNDGELETIAENGSGTNTAIHLLAQDDGIISRLATEAEAKALLNKEADKAADKPAAKHEHIFRI